MNLEIFLVNTGYALMLVAILARDILWLRSILLTAQSLLASYGWLIGNTTIMVWNALFVIFNAIQVIRILMERRPITLNETQEAIYRTVFSTMTRREFLVFWEMGTMKSLEAGVLVREGEAQEELMLLVEGNVDVRSAERVLAELGTGHFVAEMSFVSGMPASADVHVVSPVRYLAWSQQKLRSMRLCNPHLFIVLQGLLGKDLARKIHAQNKSA